MENNIETTEDVKIEEVGETVATEPKVEVEMISKEDAQKIHPSGDNYDWDLAPVFRSWPSSYDQVTAKTIGTAVKRTKTGVIVAEFKGGE